MRSPLTGSGNHVPSLFLWCQDKTGTNSSNGGTEGAAVVCHHALKIAR